MSKTRISKSEEREIVFKLLYSKDFRENESLEKIYESFADDEDVRLSGYVRNTFYGAAEFEAEANEKIEHDSKNWKISRMSHVTAAILHLSIYEMLMTYIPAKAAINEAVELAKKYDEGAAPAFINGILNRIARDSGKITDAVPNSSDSEEK